MEYCYDGGGRWQSIHFFVFVLVSFHYPDLSFVLFKTLEMLNAHFTHS